MIAKRIAVLLVCCAAVLSTQGNAQQTSDNSMVKMTTSLGEITIELYPDQAPETVENFLQYTDSGFFDGTIFHRVIPGFVLQGGGFTPDMERKETREPIPNESDNGLKNLRGTLSMARLPDPHSATSQFFVNLVDNPHLDHQGGAQWGYAVFGKVVEGMEVIDQIGGVETTTRAGHRDVPAEPVVIEEARRL
jgi:cyclophilin family peptidyl-prolyl cis-trans isomerase